MPARARSIHQRFGRVIRQSRTKGAWIRVIQVHAIGAKAKLFQVKCAINWKSAEAALGRVCRRSWWQQTTGHGRW